MNKANLLNIVIVVFLLCVILGSLIFGADNAQTITAVSDVAENVVEGSGIVTVYSNLIYSNEDGYALFSVEDGKMIKKYTTVASVYSGEITKETEERLKLLNDRITFSKSTEKYEDEVFNDIGSINKEINNRLSEISTGTGNGDYSEVYSHKSRVITYHKKSLELKGEAVDGITTDKMSDEEITGLEKELNVKKNVYTSPSDGMFSSRVDNFDILLSPDIAKTLTPKQYKELVKTDIENISEVKKDHHFAKIINNYEWYLVASFKTDEISDLEVGSPVKIRVKSISEDEVSATVVHLSDESDKERVMVVKSTKYIEGIYHSDKVEFEIVKKSYKGLKLPVSCLIKKDGAEGVYATKGGVYRFVPVNVLYRDKNYVIVEDNSIRGRQGANVILYDLVVTNPGHVKEGSIAGGAL